jgi:Fic family protein
MQVVSGQIGRERIHFEAPPAEQVDGEMRAFLEWWQTPPKDLDGLLRAAISHLWFVTVHPFEDGNGRVARAVTELALAQDEHSGALLCSMSTQIHRERDQYYEQLERAQKSDCDITGWLVWFLGCLQRAMLVSLDQIARAKRASLFWQVHAHLDFNARQRKALVKLLEAGPDGFEGGLTNRKYVGMARVSAETAKRDLAELLQKGVLARGPGGGRSVRYELAWFRSSNERNGPQSHATTSSSGQSAGEDKLEAADSEEER